MNKNTVQKIQGRKECEGIDVSKLNILHWTIFTHRDDVFTDLLDTFFKKIETQKPEGVTELRILQRTLAGINNSRMFKLVQSADQPNVSSRRQDDRVDCFTLQLRGAG